MGIKSKAAVNLVVPSPAPLPVPPPPTLYWAGFQDYRSCIRPLKGYSREGTLGTMRYDAIEPFVESLKIAQQRIWILDRHFDGEGISPIYFDLYAAFERGVEVRIITTRRNELISWRGEMGFDFPDNKAVQPGPDRIHDRFAIIDIDLWHFGHTVGGWRPEISAASHGWHQHVAPFEKIYKEAWDGCQFEG